MFYQATNFNKYFTDTWRAIMNQLVPNEYWKHSSNLAW